MVDLSLWVLRQYFVHVKRLALRVLLEKKS